MGKQKIGKFYGRALVVPESLNVESREVEVVFATETPVFRCGWDEDFNEVLSCTPEAVRLGKTKKGLPVLDGHNGWSLHAQLGRAQNIRIADKECRATVVFSKRAEVEGIFQDVKDGIISDVSVGYRVFKFERTPAAADEKYPTYRALDWEPFEISFTPIPADINCGVRDDNKSENEVEIIHTKNSNNNKNLKKMVKVKCPTCEHEWETEEADNYTCPECQAEFAATEEPPAGNAPPPATTEEENPPVRSNAGTKPNVAAIHAAASEQEKKRLNAILLSSRAAGLQDAYAIELYTSNRALDECRHAIIEKAVSGQKSVNGNHVSVGKEGIEKKREAAQEAILSRAIPHVFTAEKGNYFRGMTLVEIGKELLRERGIGVNGKNKSEIADMVFGRAHSTSDFPLLFEGSINKALRADYKYAKERWSDIARQTTVTDFRKKNLYQFDTANGMHITPEGGEIKYTKMVEAKQTIGVVKWAQGILFTREAFINDDLDALSAIPTKFVRDWDRTRGDEVWGLVTKNTVMDDGKALFHSDHNNFVSGASSALSEDGLTNALLKFRTQKDLAGQFIAATPTIIIVPVHLEVAAKKLLTAIQASNTTDVNVFSGAFELIVERRLTDPKAWYMFADPADIDGLYYAYLDGNDGLRVNSEDDFKTDAMKYAVRSEFGVQAVDFRGMVKMAGA